MTFLALLVALLLTVAPLAFCQTLTTGDLSGVVADSSGAVVPGAVVTIKSVDTNETRTEVSNQEGRYRFSLLSPGDYTVSAQTAALKSNTTKFSVAVGQEERLNLTVRVQGTQETVMVTAESPIIQTENANLTTSVSSQQVVSLPMNGGDLTTVAFTVPGIRMNVGGGNGNFHANGIPLTGILFTINGADVMDPYNNLNNSGASNNLLGANEVSEAAVIINAFSPEYGRRRPGEPGGQDRHQRLPRQRDLQLQRRDLQRGEFLPERHQHPQGALGCQPVRGVRRRAHPQEQDLLLCRYGSIALRPAQLRHGDDSHRRPGKLRIGARLAFGDTALPGRHKALEQCAGIESRGEHHERNRPAAGFQ
jgi:hypothetical protein